MVQLLYYVAVFLVGYAAFAPIFGITGYSWTLLINNSIFAILSVALAKIIEKQNEILKKLDRQDDKLKWLPREKKLCEKCNHSYDMDYKSCPKCGNAN